MKIKDEYGNLIDTLKIEVREQHLVKNYIDKNDIVLELGARYGSVSITINKILTNKNNQVVVEPDDRVWEALEINKINNNCSFNIVNGFISKKKLSLTNLKKCHNGYGSTFVYNSKSNIPIYSFEYIKTKYNLKFNVLVADCEGFLETFFDENPCIYDNLRMIIYEADYPEKCNYVKIEQTLYKNNFILTYNIGKHYVWHKNK